MIGREQRTLRKGQELVEAERLSPTTEHGRAPPARSHAGFLNDRRDDLVRATAQALTVSPLVNRDEDRLIYIRQTAPGVGPATATAAGAILFSAALVASWLPAARASRLDVVEALRSE